MAGDCDCGVAAAVLLVEVGVEGRGGEGICMDEMMYEGVEVRFEAFRLGRWGYRCRCRYRGVFAVCMWRGRRAVLCFSIPPYAVCGRGGGLWRGVELGGVGSRVK